MLKRLGHSVYLAENGQQAVVMCSEKEYDLIFMDCQMPVMDGYEASSAIKLGDGRNKNTPIIAMTAATMKEDRERCFSSGMDDYICKPVIISKLEETIRSWRYKSTIGWTGI